MNSTSMTFGVVLGNAAAASIDLFDTITIGTGTAVVDFADGFSAGYSARRASDIASRQVLSAPKRTVTATVILLAA